MDVISGGRPDRGPLPDVGPGDPRAPRPGSVRASLFGRFARVASDWRALPRRRRGVVTAVTVAALAAGAALVGEALPPPGEPSQPDEPSRPVAATDESRPFLPRPPTGQLLPVVAAARRLALVSSSGTRLWVRLPPPWRDRAPVKVAVLADGGYAVQFARHGPMQADRDVLLVTSAGRVHGRTLGARLIPDRDGVAWLVTGGPGAAQVRRITAARGPLPPPVNLPTGMTAHFATAAGLVLAPARGTGPIDVRVPTHGWRLAGRITSRGRPVAGGGGTVVWMSCSGCPLQATAVSTGRTTPLPLPRDGRSRAGDLQVAPDGRSFVTLESRPGSGLALLVGRVDRPGTFTVDLPAGTIPVLRYVGPERLIGHDGERLIGVRYSFRRRGADGFGEAEATALDSGLPGVRDLAVL